MSAKWWPTCAGLGRTLLLLVIVLGTCIQGVEAEKATASRVVFRFAVSGDSRDCGNVVMPAMARKVAAGGASFFWHLGDFRSIVDFDADMQHEPEHRTDPMSCLQYHNHAWADFIEYQLKPFGALPVYLAIGNHEIIPPKTRDEYLITFADWLNTPVLREQRLRDDPRDHRLKAWYHWTQAGVDFINLDNASTDQFDAKQLEWLEKVLVRDERDPSIRTIVVGLHAALPDSVAAGHGMNRSLTGTVTGRQVYASLLRVRDQAHKRVYVVASHAHYYRANVYDTPYWREHGGVLPGWIVGTGGATRYAPPQGTTDENGSVKPVYGFLMGTVRADGQVDFAFQKVLESDVPADVVKFFTPEFVHWCFAENVGRPGMRHGWWDGFRAAVANRR